MATPPNYDTIKRLIAEKKRAEAQKELEKILDKNPDDAEGWWLYAHIAEDRDQLYHSLHTIVELPMNPYTGKARAMLAKLPYQPADTKSGKQILKRQSGSSLIWIGLAVVVIAVVLIIGVVALASGSRPAAVAVVAQPATATVTVITVITMTPPPTDIPAPSGTPAPTATRRAVMTSTPLPTATTTTDAAANLTTVLPKLNESLMERSAALFKAADTVSDALSTTDKLSDNALKAVTEQTSQIRKLRNDILLVNLAQVPADIRQDVITPAHAAYTDYANSLLQWIDLKMQVDKALAAAQSTPDKLNTTSTTLNTAQQNVEKQTGLAAQQAEVVKAKRAALEKALNDYSIFTAQTVLTAQNSKQSNIYTSQSAGPIQISAGKYKVSYRVGALSTNSPTIQLVPVNGKGSKVTLTTGTKSGTLDGQVLELKAGSYQVQADSVNWWVLALDPQ